LNVLHQLKVWAEKPDEEKADLPKPPPGAMHIPYTGPFHEGNKCQPAIQKPTQ
jgi:hypothetical protein